jgi:hypothetical protein
VRVTKQKHDAIDLIPADLAWSAAQAAYRINGGYLKQPLVKGDKIVKPTNREIVKIALHDLSLITDADRELAQQMRKFMASTVTMQALKTELGEWERITAQICGLDVVDSLYALSVITAMPHSYAKTLKKESVDARLARTQEGGLQAKVGDKVDLTVEIVRNNYSAKFNTWFISAITNDNYAVFFAYREAMQPDTCIKIRGTVKRHTDRSTQLNRVKLVGDKE